MVIYFLLLLRLWEFPHKYGMKFYFLSEVLKCIALYFSLLLPSSYFRHAPRFPLPERTALLFEEKCWSSTAFSMDYITVFASCRGFISPVRTSVQCSCRCRAASRKARPGKAAGSHRYQTNRGSLFVFEGTLSNTEPRSLRGTGFVSDWKAFRALWSAWYSFCVRSAHVTMHLFFQSWIVSVWALRCFFGFTDLFFMPYANDNLLNFKCHLPVD